MLLGGGDLLEEVSYWAGASEGCILSQRLSFSLGLIPCPSLPGSQGKQISSTTPSCLKSFFLETAHQGLKILILWAKIQYPSLKLLMSGIFCSNESLTNTNACLNNLCQLHFSASPQPSTCTPKHSDSYSTSNPTVGGTSLPSVSPEQRIRLTHTEYNGIALLKSIFCP